MPRIVADTVEVLEAIADNAEDWEVRVAAEADLGWMRAGNEWYDEYGDPVGDGPDNVDVCMDCYWLCLNDVISVDDFIEHPDYDYWLGPNDPYTCDICGKALVGSEDN